MNIGDNFLCTQECQALIEVEFDPCDSLNLQNRFQSEYAQCAN